MTDDMDSKRKLTLVLKKVLKQKAEITRLTKQVHGLKEDKAALLSKIKFYRGERD